MAKKLICVGVLDSLFPENTDLKTKIELYEKAICLKEFNTKIENYNEKIKQTEDPKEIHKITKNRDKFILTGPKPIKVDLEYTFLSPQKEFLIKKSIFPTININLHELLCKYSNTKLLETGRFMLIKGSISKKDYRLLPGDYLQRIDCIAIEGILQFCVAGYVLDMSQFTYKNNTKKALKLIIDSSGYISEKVLWPDYNTGELIYPEDLKKGCIAYFFYQKKENKPYTNIIDIIVEENSLGK